MQKEEQNDEEHCTRVVRCQDEHWTNVARCEDNADLSIADTWENLPPKNGLTLDQVQIFCEPYITMTIRQVNIFLYSRNYSNRSIPGTFQT